MVCQQIGSAVSFAFVTLLISHCSISFNHVQSEHSIDSRKWRHSRTLKSAYVVFIFFTHLTYYVRQEQSTAEAAFLCKLAISHNLNSIFALHPSIRENECKGDN